MKFPTSTAPANYLYAAMACADTKRSQYIVHTIPGSNYVGAVTSLGDEIYVARLNNNQSIEVYDATTFEPRSCLIVPGRGYCVWGLVACGRYKCLYVSDWGNDKVHRVELVDVKAVLKWSVASKPAGLSLINQHNLLVVSQGESKLQQFTTHGMLLRTIPLVKDPNRLPDQVVWQAVHLLDGNFRISWFSEGQSGVRCQPILAQNSSAVPTEECKWNRPAGLVVDKDGRVLIADWYNNRLMVEDWQGRQTTYCHGYNNYNYYGFRDGPNAAIPPCIEVFELAVPVEGGLKGPCSLSYDQELKRLYIGECEWGSYRVIVVDNVNDFSRPST